MTPLAFDGPPVGLVESDEHVAPKQIVEWLAPPATRACSRGTLLP